MTADQKFDLLFHRHGRVEQAVGRATISITKIALSLTWCATLAWLQLGGLWHAFTSHGTSTGMLSLFVPPFAWFYAVEFFFHSRS